jgi:hypothetical protein
MWADAANPATAFSFADFHQIVGAANEAGDCDIKVFKPNIKSEPKKPRPVPVVTSAPATASSSDSAGLQVTQLADSSALDAVYQASEQVKAQLAAARRELATTISARQAASNGQGPVSELDRFFASLKDNLLSDLL